MATDVLERIRDVIRERGPIPFDVFMDLSLYGAGGYYERPPVGAAGDFVTSPHVHWWFAYALALALGELDEALGTDAARIVELGAGDGTLAREMLEILADAGPIKYTAVERSAGARAALSALGVHVRSSVDELGPLDGALVFANELLDNLPFRRVRRYGDRIVEVRVGLDADRLVEVETDTDAELTSLAPALEPGADAAVPTGALALVDALADRMRRAYALLIDYSTERGSAVHGYAHQRVVADVLERPGSTDVTAAVDFDLVERRAREHGLVVLGRVTQRAALLALGFGRWIEAERDGGSAIDPRAAARAWAARSRATLLVDPAGLGAHRWLLLGTRGLPSPRWLERAGSSRSAD